MKKLLIACVLMATSSSVMAGFPVPAASGGNDAVRQNQLADYSLTLNGTNNQYENAWNDMSANMALMTRTREKVKNGENLTVMVYADAWGTPSSIQSGMSRGIMMELIDQYGYAGAAGEQVNFNDNIGTGGDMIPVSLSGTPRIKCDYETIPASGAQPGYTIDTADALWLAYYHMLDDAGDAIRFIQYASTPLNKTHNDQIGLYWIAQPNGGDFIFGARQGGSGAWTDLATLDGYAATPTVRYTNFTSTVWLDTAQLYVTNSTATTNYIIGPEVIDTTAGGIIPTTVFLSGGPMDAVNSTVEGLIGEYVDLLQPDMVLWHWGDLGQLQSNTEAYYLNLVTNNMRNIFDGATDCNVVMLSMNYHNDPTLINPEIEEDYIRAGAIANQWTYYDARYTAGSFETITNTYGVGADPVMLTPEAQLAYARAFLIQAGLIGVPHQDPDVALLSDGNATVDSPLAAWYTSQTNQWTGSFGFFDAFGNMTGDRAGAYIVVPEAGIYEMRIGFESLRDVNTFTVFLYENGVESPYQFTGSGGPGIGWNETFTYINYDNTAKTCTLYSAVDTASTFATNAYFMVERKHKRYFR